MWLRERSTHSWLMPASERGGRSPSWLLPSPRHMQRQCFEQCVSGEQVTYENNPWLRGMPGLFCLSAVASALISAMASQKCATLFDTAYVNPGFSHSTYHHAALSVQLVRLLVGQPGCPPETGWIERVSPSYKARTAFPLNVGNYTS